LESADSRASHRQKRVLDAFDDIVLHNRLFLNLISSSAFESYFKMLASVAGTKLLPERLLVPDISTFRPRVEKAEEGGEEKAEEEEEEEEEEEAEAGDAFSFLRFLKTLVVHFTAKRYLERQSLQMKDDDINVSLFSVDRSPLVIPVGSWSKMEEKIRSLFSSADENMATKAIKILKDKVSGLGPEGRREKSKFDNLLEDFKRVVDNSCPIVYSGGLHCEAVLATLRKYSESILGSEGDDSAELISTCKVLLLFTCLVVLSEHLSLEST